MKFNTIESYSTEKKLFCIPIVIYCVWVIIQNIILNVPMPRWSDYAFSGYLLLGFIYFCFLHKYNKADKQ